MNARTRCISVGIVAVSVVFFASTAFAQYLKPAESGYLPSQPNAQVQEARRQGNPQPYSPPPTRFGIAFDFGAGALQNVKLDRDFFAPNGAPPMHRLVAASWDLTLYAQFIDSFRVGLNVGQMIGGKTDRSGNLLHVGLNLEGGHRFRNGLGLWLGADVGYGRGHFQSTTPKDNIYTHVGRGIGVRGFARIEYSVAPFATLRLTPFVDTVARTNEWYQEDVWKDTPPMVYPRNTHGTFLGYGVMIGVSFHTF